MDHNKHKPSLKDTILHLTIRKDLLTEIMALAEKGNFSEIITEKLAHIADEIKTLTALKIDVAKTRNTRKKQKRQQ
ncbi:MAG: hypothetical protein K9G26_07530 [Emcibacter sp.]|nr:hypothetical protein [Emcibacter sp.]